MAVFYRMQLLLAAYALLLTSFTLATSSTTTTSSKEEIKCDTCIPVSYPSPPPPPPLVIDCPPPPPPPKPLPPPKPTCPSCAPPCYACQNPTTPLTPAQPGGIYSPPNQVVPYFQYSYQYPPPSAASTAHMGLKLFVSVILLTLSATLSEAYAPIN